MDLPFLGVTVRITIVYHILQRVAELGLHANNTDKELERHSKEGRLWALRPSAPVLPPHCKIYKDWKQHKPAKLVRALCVILKKYQQIAMNKTQTPSSPTVQSSGC